jgi:hypothetical protein
VVARITELNLLLLLLLHADDDKKQKEKQETHDKNNTRSADELVEQYAAYQRRVLRDRVKPAVAALVRDRQRGNISNSPFATTTKQQQQQRAVAVAVESDVENEGTFAPGVMQQHHAPVLTVILGEAAALLHPLAAWRASLPADDGDEAGCIPLSRCIRRMCEGSIQQLNEQAQALCKTVSDWFWEDRGTIIEQWMKKSNQGTVSLLHDDNDTTTTTNAADELGILDAIVEEMAFGCQLFARYQALMAGIPTTTATEQQQQQQHVIIQQELLPEWTWKYATLERFLAVNQWHTAVAHAEAVKTVIGTDIQVPSTVEDAQYLSRKALERAASTQSIQAMGTVAYTVSHDVWSTEIIQGSPAGSSPHTVSVYQALLEGRGCWNDPVGSAATPESEKKKGGAPKTPTSSGFASALLDALDDDLGTSQQQQQPSHQKSPVNKSPPPAKLPSAPSSGTFLAALTGDREKTQRRQLDTLFCVLNGIHAASTGCRLLVNFLDSLLPSEEGEEEESPSGEQEDKKGMAMMQLAREELFRYAESYEKLLSSRIEEALTAWCGSAASAADAVSNPMSRLKQRGLCFHDLRFFLDEESYTLDGTSIAAAEADERLERDLLGPLKESRFLGQLADKCEAAVLQRVGQRVAAVAVEVLLDTLWETESSAGKQFNEWGALLLSKQVRMLQTYVTSLMNLQSSRAEASSQPLPNILMVWEHLSEVLTVLQLEKPYDWLAYQSSLSAVDLSRTLSLRVDFSSDAVQSVVATVASQQEKKKENGSK